MTWLAQVIAYTILDINRTTRLNGQPMTPEQHRQLAQMASELQSKSGMTWTRPHECTNLRQSLSPVLALVHLLNHFSYTPVQVTLYNN